MPLDPQASWIPSPFYSSGRSGYQPRYLILHGTAGGSSAAGVASWFQDPRAQVSAHYIVGQDGQIIQCVDEADSSWSNGILSAGHDPWWSSSFNPNLFTISIEHVKPSTDNHDALSSQQQTASFALIQRICQRWNIPMRPADAQGGITGHFSIDPINRKDCPGLFPWQDLWQTLSSENIPIGGLSMIPIGWTDTNAILTAPNGIPVEHGFRNFILSHTWDPSNWPLQAEQGLSQLEQGNPSLGAGTQQVFRWTVLEWTAQRGTFVMWVGQELLRLRVLLASYPQTIRQQQQQLTALQLQLATPKEAK